MAMENKQREEFMAEDLGQTLKANEDMRPSKTSRVGMGLRGTVMVTGGAVLVLIVAFVLILRAHQRAVMVDLNTINLRLKMLEGRMTHLEKEVPALEGSLSKSVDPQRVLTQKLDALSKKMDELQKGLASATPPTAGTQTVHSLSKGPHHEVQRGETLYQISRKYGVSVAELCRVNEMDPSQVIKPGQRLRIPGGGPE